MCKGLIVPKPSTIRGYTVDFEGIKFCVLDDQALGIVSNVEFGTYSRAAAEFGAGDQVDS